MLLTACSDFLRRRLPAPLDGRCVLAAVSGGLDSMAMLHLLQRCRREKGWNLHLVVVHFNHQLRPAAAAEERFVAAYCRQHHLPLLIGQGRGLAARRRQAGGSLEEIAREARYAFFARCLDSWPDSWLLTAHTASDQLETVLLNLLRGSGLRGLKGIPRRRERFLRPLLLVSRRELECYVREQGIDFVVDESNASLEFTRNRLRHRVLPLLREIAGPELDNRVAVTAAGLAEEWEFIAAAVEDFCRREVQRANDRLSCSRTAFLAQAEALQPHILARLLQLAGRKKPANRQLLADLLSLVRRGGGRSGKGYRLGAALYCRLDETRLIFTWAEETAPMRAAAPMMIPAPGRYRLPGNGRLSLAYCQLPDTFPGAGNGRREYVDAGRLDFPLQVRYWQPGDRFCPLGLGGRRQKLKKFFIDSRLPVREKSRIPLLCCEGEIVWVMGRRLDERFALRPETKRCLELVYDV